MPPTNAPKKPLPTNVAKLTKKKGRNEEDELMDEWKRSRQLLRPKDQVELSDADLKEIVPRILLTTNLQYPDSLVQFDYASGSFIPIPSPGNAIVIFQQKGTYLHKECDEARKQMIAQGIDPAELLAPGSDEASMIGVEEQQDLQAEEVEGEGEGEGEEGDEGDGGEAPEGEGGGEAAERPRGGKKLTNQFNFCERAALTYNNPVRSRETQTVPPPLAPFSGHVLQWIIYDGYQHDFAEQQMEKEKEREKREKDKMPISKHPAPIKKLAGKVQLSEAVQGRVYECWKTIERMINQNTYNEIAKDYRYWEDPADEFREDGGTLLPLWKFIYDKTKKNTVCDFSWNPHYYDMFAVCFGFLDFMKPLPGGAICFFTIKNPSYPDYICMTESPVMCVDIHKNLPYMVIIGLYDGNVLVYNIQASCKEPAFACNSVTQKHTSIVWEVKWAPDLPDGEMNFFSVSVDGKINHWVLMQNELAVTTVINLYLDTPQVRGPDGTFFRKKACASCVKFHPTNLNIYLVGTEEGLIYKCSTEYSSAYLLTYKAHNMPVYRIDYNNYNSDIFASCSGDWRIKIWEDERLEPLFVFDLGCSVGDINWAPYSSTVFGAVTSKGKAYIFDLNINKYKAICEQSIVSRKKYKLTRIRFNHKLPIIICGDDKGCVTLLKLSPNLRIPCKAPKKQQHLDQITLQKMKLDKLLSLVREPDTISIPPDTVGSAAPT